MQLTEMLKCLICGLSIVAKVVSGYMETSKLGKGYRKIVKLSTLRFEGGEATDDEAEQGGGDLHIDKMQDRDGQAEDEANSCGKAFGRPGRRAGCRGLY